MPTATAEAASAFYADANTCLMAKSVKHRSGSLSVSPSWKTAWDPAPCELEHCGGETQPATIRFGPSDGADDDDCRR